MNIGAAAPLPAAAHASKHRRHRHAHAQFLVALVLVLLSVPFVERPVINRLVEPLQLTVVLLGGLWVVSERRRTLVVGLLLAIPALLASWLDHHRPDAVPNWTFAVPAVAFCFHVVAEFLRFILRARRVNSEVLCAGAAGYLLLGLLWTFAYVLLGTLLPDAFRIASGIGSPEEMRGSTALYFSFVTLTTVGFGDIVPLAPAARLLAISESTIGVFYTTMLIARLVALYSSHESHHASTERSASHEP